MNSILRACDNREVRRQMYEAGNSSPEGNRLATLSNLIKSRNDAAEILGFPSHADFMTASMLSKTPNGVKVFLRDLSSQVREIAEGEFKMLEKLQKQNASGGREEKFVAGMFYT